MFASLVVARVLTPMMAAYMLKPDRHRRTKDAALDADLHALGRLEHEAPLRHDRSLAALFFFGSVALIPLLPTGFIPPDDNSQTQVYLELPPGATLEQTKATAEAGAR